MLATVDEFERVPRILRLNVAGHPMEWVTWQDAVCLYARELVVWTIGAPVLHIRGGHSRFDSTQSSVDIHGIIACGGKVVAPAIGTPPLTNSALFGRDRNLCLYCGNRFADAALTRDHVAPISRGGRDEWDNCVAACRRCNHFKGNRMPGECGLELLALPYVPNFAEYLALTNSRRILGDQMDFLRKSFGADSRLLH
jgi:hypothetical protein